MTGDKVEFKVVLIQRELGDLLVKHFKKLLRKKAYSGQNVVNLLGKLHMQTARCALCAYNQLFIYCKYILKKVFLIFLFAFTDSYV